jgi:hypothetical protein
MSRMFIANLTQQIQVFCYRVVEEASPFRQEIPIGGQIMIAKDLSPADVELIIGAHQVYGMIRAEDVDRATGLVPTCFQMDKRISIQIIEKGLRHNRQVLEIRGREQRKQSAVLTSNAINDRLASAEIPAGLAEVDISIVEEEPKGGYQHDKPVGEGIKVSATEPGDPPPAARRGQGRRKAA